MSRTERRAVMVARCLAIVCLVIALSLQHSVGDKQDSGALADGGSNCHNSFKLSPGQGYLIDENTTISLPGGGLPAGKIIPPADIVLLGEPVGLDLYLAAGSARLCWVGVSDIRKKDLSSLPWTDRIPLSEGMRFLLRTESDGVFIVEVLKIEHEKRDLLSRVVSPAAVRFQYERFSER